MDKEEYDSIHESAELRSTAKIERKIFESDNLLQTDPIYYTNGKKPLFKKQKKRMNEDEELEDFFDVDIFKDDSVAYANENHSDSKKSVMSKFQHNEEYDWLNDLIKISDNENNEYESQRVKPPAPHVDAEINISINKTICDDKVKSDGDFDIFKEEELLQSLNTIIHDLEIKKDKDKKTSVRSIDRLSEKQKYDALEQYFDPFLSDIQVNTKIEQNMEHSIADSRYTNKSEERKRIINLFESKYASNGLNTQNNSNIQKNEHIIESQRELKQEKYNLTTVSPLKEHIYEAKNKNSRQAFLDINISLKQEVQDLQQELVDLSRYHKQINDEIFYYQCKNDQMVSKIASMFNSNLSNASQRNPKSIKQSFSDNMSYDRPLTPNSIFDNKKLSRKYFESEIEYQKELKSDNTSQLNGIKNERPEYEGNLNRLLSPNNINVKIAENKEPQLVPIFKNYDNENLLFDETVDNQNLIDSLKNVEKPMQNYHTFANKNPKISNTLNSKLTEDKDKYSTNKLREEQNNEDDSKEMTPKLEHAVVIKSQVKNDKVDHIINYCDNISQNSEFKQEISEKFTQLKDALMTRNTLTKGLDERIEEEKILSKVDKQAKLQSTNTKKGYFNRSGLL